MLLSAFELAGLRSLGEEDLTSRCDVRRKTGGHIVVDRLKVPEWETVHVDLPFKLAGASEGRSRLVTIGGVAYDDATAIGKMPALTSDLADDDLIDITAGQWAGTVWRIVKATMKDRAVVRRVPIVESPRPEEWA